MEEQMLFTRVHDALDVPTPPGAYERLRTQLTKKPERPFLWPALEARWEKKGFKLAAGLAIIAIAAGAAALAVRSTANNRSPAGTSMSIAAYQKMVADDFNALGSKFSGPCDEGIHDNCVANSTRGIPTLQGWIDDLSRPGIPARFAVINDEMRKHLLQGLAALRDVITAGEANDGPAMDRAIIVLEYMGPWAGTVVTGISSSAQVDAARYVNGVTTEKKFFFDSCVSSCTLLVSPQAFSCTTNGGVSCLQLFNDVGVVYANFSKDLVQYAAPDSLASKDARLQTDLAAADSVLRTMRVAVAANDQVGINSGVEQLIRLNATIDRDAAKIAG